MEIFQQIESLSAFISGEKGKKHSIGLVPTMGALHAGHLSLIEKAQQENDHVVVSIFVNPTQFDNKNDLEKYPRTLETDIKLIESLGTDISVFAPSVEEVYSDDVSSVKFDFDGLENEMEGSFRQGHFDGVGTIVKRLFEIVTPDRAYFGEKDYQQLMIIRKLVEKQKLDVEVIGCPIKRETNGLAMSSRNERLPADLREKASLIYSILLRSKEKFGMENADNVIVWVKEEFKKHPDFTLEYFEIADANSLKAVKSKEKNKQYRAFIAVYVNEVRLIDNIALN